MFFDMIVNSGDKLRIASQSTFIMSRFSSDQSSKDMIYYAREDYIFLWWSPLLVMHQPS